MGTLRLRLLLSLVMLAPGAIVAQDTATLTGTIRDKSGAVLPDASITLTNPATGIVRQVKSNSAGEYVAAAMPPGQYNLVVTVKGFRKYQAENLTLRVAQNARIDVTMQVGDIREEVTVQGKGLAQVNTESNEVGGTITGKEALQLQLNGRNFTQLITLVPGVSNQTGQDEGVVGAAGNVNYSVNGGRTEYNNWEVDGGDMMDNGSNFSLNVYPSVEAIDEVQVLTSNYGAQYGRNGSGTVEVETKSGTNNFHGSVWEFARNEAFNAHNYFDQPDTPVAGYHKHDFGYSISGPVWKNHTFFYWLQNWRREVVPYTFFNFVPSVANREGNFSDQCNIPNPTDCPVDSHGNRFPNDQIPFIDPNGQALLPMIPLPNTTTQTTNGTAATFAESVGQPTRWLENLFRIDHDFNSKWRATFRYIHDSWDTTSATATFESTNFPTIRTHFVGPGVETVARVTATLSPTWLNEFVASYTTDHLQITNTNPSVWTRTDSNFTMPGIFPSYGGKLPDICLSTSGAYGGYFCEGPTAFPWSNSNPTFTYRDNVTKSLGKHKLVFGGYFVNAEKNEYSFTDLGGDLTFDSTAPISTGNAFADLLMGNIANFQQANAQPKYHFNYKTFEPFFQDDYHIRKNLTLNLGFRASFYGTFWDHGHQVSNWDPLAYDPSIAPTIRGNNSSTGPEGSLNVKPGTSAYDGVVQCGIGAVPRGCLNGHLFNPGPRVGFAWDPLGTGKTSIRGGYGIFFEHTNGEEVNAENLEGTPPLVQEPTQYNVVGYNSIAQGYLFPLATVSIPDNAQWPYVQQWHLDVQRDVIMHAVATLAYVGAKGTRLTLQHEANALQPIPASQNPYVPGESIDAINPHTGQPHDDCDTGRTSLGVKVTGQALINLNIACGNDPNPYRPYYSLDSIERFEPVANSNYNALQFSLRKTDGPLTLDVAYTYSHSLDDSSDRYDGNFVNSYDIHSNYASSNYDQRHILTIAWVYEEPYFAGKGLSHTFLGGWQFAGIMTSQSGEPFSVVDGIFGDNAGVADGVTGNGSYADIVGNPHAAPDPSCIAPYSRGAELFNCAAFQQPTGLTFGDSRRNSLTMPHRTNFDMSVYKIFKPTEKVQMQFRAEGFDIFNHPQWSSVNNYVGTQNFLYSTGAHMPRVLQFALRISF